MTQPAEFEARLAQLLESAKEDGLTPEELAKDLYHFRRARFSNPREFNSLSGVLRMLVIDRYLPVGFTDQLQQARDERIALDLLRVSTALSQWVSLPLDERLAKARIVRTQLHEIIEETP